MTNADIDWAMKQELRQLRDMRDEGYPIERVAEEMEALERIELLERYAIENGLSLEA